MAKSKKHYGASRLVGLTVGAHCIERPLQRQPIRHEFQKNFIGAEHYCHAMLMGGWAAKLKHTPSEGWSVTVTGFAGGGK